MKGEYFVCYACCIPVKGHARSVVVDLQRNAFLFIPNVLVDILGMSRERTVAEIIAHYGEAHAGMIGAYFDHLAAQDYGFYTDGPQRFPALNLDWRNPTRITNCILDFGPDTQLPLQDIGAQLSTLGCEALQIRFFRAAALEELARHVAAFHDSTLRSIELLVGYDPSLDPQSLDAFMAAHPRVKRVTVHSSPGLNSFRELSFDGSILYTEEVVASEACCGQVSSFTFCSGTSAFLEARQFNSCLNRKISIDQHGAIKNCPSMSRSFGDIRSVSLQAALAEEDFQRPWSITKDQVLVCRDCEFRYICHDCRAYVEDPENPLSKPAKCRYDPYEARWEAEGHG